MKNKRLRLSEAETMNVVSLEDLLDLSSKVLGSILDLQTSTLKFNNKRAMILATKLSTSANEFHNMISKLVMENGPNAQGKNVSGEDDEEDTRQDLSAEDNLGMGQERLESAKLRYMRRKKLKEAEEEESGEEEENQGNEVEDQPTEGEKNIIVVIDLTEPYKKVVDGLDDSEFSEFKSDVVDKLEGNIDHVEEKVGNQKADEFAKSVSALSASKSPEDFDFAMNQLYDFADKNDIMIETVMINKKPKLNAAKSKTNKGNKKTR